MDQSTSGGRTGLACCLILALLVLVPIAALAVAAWLLLRQRDRIVARFRDRLPEGCMGSVPAAALRAYRDFVEEVERPGAK